MSTHPYYMMDPALLPAAGIKRERREGHSGTSAALSARQDQLVRWHVEQQQATLRRLGQSTLLNPVSAVAAAQLTAAPAGTIAATTPRRPNIQPSRRDQRMNRSRQGQNAPGLDLLIDGLRRRLQQKGVKSMTSLEALFKDMDVDGSGVLSTAEFRKGLLEEGVLQTAVECDLLFAYFDEDRSGSIDFNEFLDVVRGQLTPVRSAVVKEAFDTLDVIRDGVLTVEDLKLKYRSFAHPDVRNGYRSEEEVFREFLGGFDTISKNGVISFAEFTRYYEYTSALIASDELFVATVRNAWSLPGATGGNCLRVCITFEEANEGRNDDAWRHQQDVRKRGFFSGIAQTRQEIVEIRPDIGVNVSDPRFLELVSARLHEMGYSGFSNIEVISRD